MGLPIEGTPIGGTIPSGFSAQVTCDDGTSQLVTFPITGGAGTPATIDNIEAGSNCTVVELDTAGFPTGSVVSYDPVDVDSAGAFVDANETLAVTITNDFTGVQVDPGEVVKPPVVTPVVTPAPVVAPAVVASPTFTG